MVTLFSKIFIKNNTAYENPEVRQKYGVLTSIIGIGLNILLFLGKYIVGMLSGAVSVMADAFNNLSDACSSFMTLLGFHFAGKKPDKDHPFGHGRIEYIAGLGVSVLILLMGIELFQSSVSKIIHPETMDITVYTFFILAASILVKCYMAYYNLSIGKKIHSAAMKATATDSLSDCISTTVVFLSMIIYKIFGINIDGFSGLVVAILILIAGYSSAKETISPLLGTAPEKEFVEEIEKTVLAHSIVSGIHDMIVHDYGPGRKIISLHAEVPGNMDIFKIHDEIDLIEQELTQKFDCEAVIHMDPIASYDEHVMYLKEEVYKIVKEYNASLNMHDFRVVTGETHTNLIFDIVVPADYVIKDNSIETELKSRILQKWENHYAVIKVEKSYVS